MMKEKIDLLLVVPSYEESYGFVKEAKMSESPLGLGYIAAYAEKKSYKVKLMDFDALGLSVKDIAPIVKKYSPSVLGFTCTTPLIQKIIEMINIAKKADENMLVILGGPHACALPNESLKRTKADIIVRGEGEETIVDILRYVKNEIKLEDIEGVSYEKEGKIIHNKNRPLIDNLDKLPFPARHLLPIHKYIAPYHLDRSGSRFCNLIATRGCPFNCTFCGQSIIFQNKVRRRSAKNVVDEIEFMIKKYGTKVFFFEDSTFVFCTDLVKEMCEELIRRKLKIKWGATARVNLTNESLIRLMKKAGCRSLFYGVESGNQEILNKAKKGTTIRQIRKAIKVTKKVGIPIQASFIIGLPGETRKTILETIKFAIELDPDYVSFSLATPYPGTEFYNTALEEGYNFDDWDLFANARYGDPIYIPEGMTKKELKKLYALAYRRFYIRPKYIIKSLLNVRSLKEIMYESRIAISLLKKNK